MGSQVCMSPKKNEEKFGTPKIKGNIHYDEKYINVRGYNKYNLNAIDDKTKFILSENLVSKRSLSLCKSFLGKIKRWCYKQIITQYKKERKKPRSKRKLVTFVCDKFSNYGTAWKRLFNRIAKLDFGVPIACRKYGLKHNNNSVERHNREIKKRMYSLTVFQTMEGAKSTLSLLAFVHNYVNSHTELNGKTPAEEAELYLPLKKNKLLNLIRLARKLEMTIR